MFEIDSRKQVPQKTLVLRIDEILKKGYFYAVKLDCYSRYGYQKDLVLEGDHFGAIWKKLIEQFPNFLDDVSAREDLENIILVPPQHKGHYEIKDNKNAVNEFLQSCEQEFKAQESANSFLFIDEECWYHFFSHKPDQFDDQYEMLNALCGEVYGRLRTCCITTHEDLCEFDKPINGRTSKESAPIYIRGCIDWEESQEAVVKYHTQYGGKIKWCGCEEDDEPTVVLMNSATDFIEALKSEGSADTLTNDKIVAIKA